MLVNQRVIRDFPTDGGGQRMPSLAEEVRSIAHEIRRIGRGRDASPETILIDKQEAAERLLVLASRMEAER